MSGDDNEKKTKYKKVDGTSGIRGQFLETKLLSLIFYRLKHDNRIEDFQLATNFADVGAFDDICIKVKMKDVKKPLIVCMQVKHKDNSKETPKIDIVKLYHSYLKIIERFKLKIKEKNDLFQGEFQETDIYFVIYTSGDYKLGVESVAHSSIVDNLIGTGSTVKRLDVDADFKFLCKKNMEEQTISLAKKVADFVSGKTYKYMLSDELMLKYHVLLALKVFDISKIKSDKYRMATFRKDFFDTKDENLNLFKNSLYNEILEKRKFSQSVSELLNEFLASPTDVTLSKVIGTLIKYNNGQLEFVNTPKELRTKLKEQLNKVEVSPSTVNKAIDLAAREMLSKGMKVPAAFGNRDLNLSGSDEKKEKRIEELTRGLINLLDKNKSSNTITVERHSLNSGFLRHTGGLAGAIGNIFVLDDVTKLMKITDNFESLEDLAKQLHTQLTEEIKNWRNLRFLFKVLEFPKLSFDCSEYEEISVKDFLSKLLIYNKQLDEKEVQEKLKIQIEEYRRNHPKYFQPKIDAMFLKYHNAIQEWWLQPKQASYLTKDSDIFESIFSQIMEDPMLSSINFICMSKIKHSIDYTFTENVVSSLNWLVHASTTIVTETITLTAVKVLQHLKNKNCALLGLKYVVNLPMEECKVLCTELINTNIFEYIIFVYDKVQNSTDEIKTLKNIAEAVLTKKTSTSNETSTKKTATSQKTTKTVFITNSTSVKTLRSCFPITHSTGYSTEVIDEIYLTDMSVDTQKSILETTVIFQGVKVRLDLIVDDKSKAYIKGDILNKIIHNNSIELGTLNVSKQYNDIKHLYFDRRVTKTGLPNQSYKVLKTLYDVEGDVVLITAEPGMGKSTLLTHLSLETKKCHPKVWIVRVNLLEYSTALDNWKEKKTDINTLETLKLMCHVILREKLGKESNVAITLEEQNGVVYLKDCTGDQWIEFELKMFLHFFNYSKMIILVDGFDEICPHYKNEAIKCIQVINDHSQKHKIWVTSRSYSEIKMSLQEAFGNPYSIEKMSSKQKFEYLKKIWETNLVVSEFDKSQLENVDDFLKFMEQLAYPNKYTLNRFEWSLHEVYTSVWKYLVKAMNLTDRQKFMDFENRVKLKNQKDDIDIDRNKFGDHTPLQLFLKAIFFINNIKSVDKNTNKWNYEINTFSLYQQYLETNLKTIWFGNENEIDIHKPSNIIKFEEDLANCVLMHKKLAAFAIFNRSRYIERLFSKKELAEIKKMLKRIEKGEEKTGLICGVVNGIPIFIHMTFTEYFAVEYVCDLLKNENESENQIQWIQLFLDVMISLPSELIVILRYKLKNDETLLSILESYKEVIDNWYSQLCREQRVSYFICTNMFFF